MLFNCAPRLYLLCPEEKVPILEETLADYPLPERFILTGEKPPVGALVLSAVSRDWTEPGEEGKVLERQYWAPTAMLWEPVEEISSLNLEESALIPLEEVQLPRKALGVDGRYPGESGYPLVRELRLVLEGKPPADLREWYDRLPQPREERVFWLGAVGDVMPGDEAEPLVLEPGGLERVFNDTLPLLKSQDFMVGNLETAVTFHEEKVYKSFNFKVTPPVVEKMREAGFDYMSLTNNHCYDYGEKGFKDTLAWLEKYSLPTSGVGLTPETAKKPWSGVIRDQRFILLSLGAFPREWRGFDGPTMARVTPERAGILWADEEGKAAVKEAFKDSGGFNILMIHGGWERALRPDSNQRWLFRELADMGADLIIGHHTHTLQGLEYYHNTLIAYSLGNFLFPGEDPFIYADESALLSFGLYRDRIRYLRAYPVKIKGPLVRIDGNTQALPRMYTLSRELGEEPGKEASEDF